MGDVPSQKNSKKSITKIRQKTPVPVPLVQEKQYKYPNPYLNFLMDFRTAPENKGIAVKEVFKVAATNWKRLTPEEKLPYITAARKAKKPPIKRAAKLPKQPKVKRRKQKRKKEIVTAIKMPKRINKLDSKCSRCGHRSKSDNFREIWRLGQKFVKNRNTLRKKISETSLSGSLSPTSTFRSDSGKTMHMFESDISSISF